MCVNMLAGQFYAAGKVCAEIINGDTDTVKITYDTSGTSYCLREVQAYLGDSIPTGSKGNPNIGLFPAKMIISEACAKTATVTTNLAKQCSASTPYSNWLTKLAAHSSVQLSNGTGGQTAWSVGKPITPGGSWAMFTELNINCACAVPTNSPTKVRMSSCWFEFSFRVPGLH
jgi:hypothetical protein